MRASSLNTKTRREANEYKVIRVLYKTVETVENKICYSRVYPSYGSMCLASFSTSQHAQRFVRRERPRLVQRNRALPQARTTNLRHKTAFEGRFSNRRRGRLRHAGAFLVRKSPAASSNSPPFKNARRWGYETGLALLASSSFFAQVQR